MTTAVRQEETTAPKANGQFDPDEFRMTIGEHLEELRKRLILALVGFVIAAFGCMVFGEHVVRWFLLPLMKALAANHLPPQVYYTEAAESFMVYIRISLITAATIASPWLVYQMWMFVAAGLYPHERHYVTKYLPLSILLLITGMLFLYYVVLPITLQFFLAFNIGIPTTILTPSQIDAKTQEQHLVIPTFDGDPPKPANGTIWFDASQGRLKIEVEGEARVLMFASAAIASPMITLSTYIDMVVNMLLSFGIAFQMPLVVLALVRIGIFEIDQMKKARKYVYFCMSIVAAFIVPDVVTGMVALLVPLILLFELGLWLARPPRNAAPAA
jgi:sec-independent protein translocase protein TatC